MKLMKRLNKLITADAHAVLDSIEDPHALLKQAIRDMAAVIEEDELSLKQTSLHIEQLNQQAKLLDSEQNKFNQDLDLCLQSGNEELARSVVKKKLYLAQRITLNQKNAQSANEKKKLLETQIAANQEQYQLIAQQAEVLLTQLKSQEKNEKVSNQVKLNQVITEADIDIALLNEKAQREDS